MITNRAFLQALVRVAIESDTRDAQRMRSLAHYSASKLTLRRDYQRAAGFFAGGLNWDTGEVQS